MKDNDLSAAPTYRYWVMADVVFMQKEQVEEKKSGLFRRKEKITRTYVPDLRTLSTLWNWSAQMGVRLEVVFSDEFAKGCEDLWESLDYAANPFSQYVLFDSVDDLVRVLPYRPDVMTVIALPSRVLMFGGRGLTPSQLR